MSAPRRRTFLACLWLSIATIFAHALVPTGSPLVRTAGSAFSASTVDVSLGPARSEVPAKAKTARKAGPDRPEFSASRVSPAPVAAALPPPGATRAGAERSRLHAMWPAGSGARSGHPPRAPPARRA